MDTSLLGRHALVCGASAGIGRAIAIAFAQKGATLSILARRQPELHSLAPRLTEFGAPHVHVIATDLDDRPRFEGEIHEHLAQHGPIHIVLNNTGGPRPGALLDAETEDFELGFARHLLSAHFLVRACLPGMKEAGYGRFINILSSSVREPLDGLGVSNTIRGAMASWAKSISRELPAGITINSVLPGKIDTDRLSLLANAMADERGLKPNEIYAKWTQEIPEGRIGRPEELAAIVRFIASPAGGFLRGICLPVDGGQLRSI